jgi:hypothetical protein
MQGVPSSYIRDAKVDWSLEFLSSAGGQLTMGSAVLPAASFGVWAMLELIDCDFLHPTKEPTGDGAMVAAYLAAMGRDALPIVQAEIDATDNNPLTDAAFAWGAENNIQADDFMALRDWLNIALCGFGMIPAGSDSSEQVFGIDSFGAIISAVGGDLGASYDAIMWDIPLSMIGHAIAQKSKQSGAKGIARPKDMQHVKDQLAETKRRHDAGLLHEWQEKEPMRYDLDGHENADEAYRYAVLQHECRTGNKGAA